ncbi:HET-domain-containing protein [Amniculicola lignicola CBS 123094]|uniref:HET-domain-containing protein n=1 Tax=Amniculicola lignicola CBS 123094 TaxID=1392246 RepID=A0A6A5X3J7_9PLEO|nr:HET-domain-containing protein [Amniculicola lignicola CBS 123094]
MPQYRYEPLAEGEIRIIELFPAKSSDDPIVVRVFKSDIFSKTTSKNAKREDLRDVRGEKTLQIPREVDGGGKARGLVVSADDGFMTGPPVDQGEGERPFKIEALSYVWGSEENPIHIHVVANEEPEGLLDFEALTLEAPHRLWAPVTQNLAEALRYVRRPQSRYIWVDALCINQADSQEKTIQVSNMGTVYRMADNVIVWLGLEDELTRRGMEYICYFGQQILLDLGDPISRNFRPRPGAEDITAGLLDKVLELEDYLVRDLIAVTSRPWFRRLWILQEIALARTATVALGTLEEAWDDFSRGFVGIYMKDKQCSSKEEVDLWDKHQGELG